MTLTSNDPRIAPGVDAAVRDSITEFLHREAYMLEQRRFRDWLAFLAPELTYEMPVRVTRELGAEWELSPNAHVFHDTKRTLEIRIERLETEFAWAEQPPSRTRRYITNVMIEAAGAEDYLVCSNCLIYRSRGDDPNPSLLSIQRRDLLRKDGETWLIVERWGALDQSLVNAHNLSIFF